MKKIILYILFSLVINYSLGITSALANSENSHSSLDNSRLIAADTPAAGRKYVPPLIDKPDTQPGPTKKDQEEINTKNNSTTATQRIISEALLPKATTGFIGFVSMISFLMLVISGVRFVVAYGNDEAIGKAKTEAMYAIIGLVIALLAYTIVTIIANIKIDDAIK